LCPGSPELVSGATKTVNDATRSYYMVATPKPQIDLGDYKYGFRDEEDYVFKSKKGLSRQVVEEISSMKGEPDWMREYRLKALDHFEKRPMPNWGSKEIH
jgi:Fe-S cluster assembly protein SufB